MTDNSLIQNEKLKGGTFTLNENEHNLLREIFIEYNKQLSETSLRIHDRTLIPYFKLAYSKFLDLVKKFDCYEEWME